MKTIDQILVNVVLAILVTFCYFVFPITLIATLTLRELLLSYTYLIKWVRSEYHGMVSKCLHLVIVPGVLIALTSIYWIKSRRVDITNLLSPRRIIARLKETWESAVNSGNLAVNQAVRGRIFAQIDRTWSWIKHRAISEAAQESDVDVRLERVVEEPVADEIILHEEPPIREFENVQRPPVEELNVIEAPARVRTQEEQRLHRCIEDLEALEAEGLPETMTTEEAILLVMTRTAAANGKGVVCYSLSEKQGPYGRDHRPEVHQHQILRPHNLYYKLHTSRGNVFRPDEPDCAICYSPLVTGEAMVTHDTCRRTFHEICYSESLRRRKSCPFDREWFVARSAAHVDPRPVANPIQNNGLLEQPIANPLAPTAPQDPWAVLVPPLQPQPQPPRPQPQQPPVQTPQPQAQPPRPVRTYRGRPRLVNGTRPHMQGPASEMNRPPLAGPHVPNPGNDITQNNAPRNEGRPSNNRRQPSNRRARNGVRRPWR